jgi:hypothetical protein
MYWEYFGAVCNGSKPKDKRTDYGQDILIRIVKLSFGEMGVIFLLRVKKLPFL